jgi:2-amino-4-hydroxy-6-hydroxymethyldihydropteridine diphosphokinase
MNRAYLSIGTNRGDRTGNLNEALRLLGELAGKIISVSSVYETPPWKMVDSTDFLNQTLLLETNHTALQLMDSIFHIEKSMGRARTSQKYEPRIIDIDILFFNNEILNEEGLIIPHSLLQERRFILEPMAEIAPEFLHPILKKSMKELLHECIDESEIIKRVAK